MDKWDQFALIGYLVTWVAFTLTLCITIKAAVRQKHGEAEAHRTRAISNIIAALVAAAWPISLPICAVLATAAIIVGRKR